jgi:uncharacterized glyoxalase superfamily protein PhnB
MAEDQERPPVSSSVCYRDPIAALKWLETAFGFEPRIVVLAPDETLVHAELGHHDGVIGVGGAWSPHHASPADLGGRNTQSVHIQLREDVDAHYARAKAAGAEILMEPADQTYGDRNYIARDLEGHVWSFGETRFRIDNAEFDRKHGTTTRDRI